MERSIGCGKMLFTLMPTQKELTQNILHIKYIFQQKKLHAIIRIFIKQIKKRLVFTRINYFTQKH